MGVYEGHQWSVAPRYIGTSAATTSTTPTGANVDLNSYLSTYARNFIGAGLFLVRANLLAGNYGDVQWHLETGAATSSYVVIGTISVPAHTAVAGAPCYCGTFATHDLQRYVRLRGASSSGNLGFHQAFIIPQVKDTRTI